MTIIRAYTTVEQSRKLAEILPIESADMCYINGDSGKISIGEWGNNVHDEDDLPCWSLASLLCVLPKSIIYTPNPALDGYCCKNIMHDLETYGENPVDTCYEIILKLNELKML